MHKTDRRALLAGAGAFVAATPAFAAQETRDATAIVADERIRAAAEGKRLLLSFYASWCVWCRFMDEFLAEPATERVIGTRYRILHIRALERRESERRRQWAGADEVYARYSGGEHGLPYLAFLDAQGEVFANSVSLISGDNVGFPVTPVELDSLDLILERVAPDATPGERLAARAACMRLAPRRR